MVSNLLDNFLAIYNADSTAVVQTVQLLSLQFIDAVVSMKNRFWTPVMGVVSSQLKISEIFT